jgi:GNAT superfamily N-acetyltransferase
VLSISKGVSVSDRKSIEEILQSAGFFYDFEIEIALSLFDDTITYGTENCSYHWMKLNDEDGIAAFANYVKNSFSVHSWDLYWIAVRHNLRHKNLGTMLLKAVEDDIQNSGDTSGRPLYAPTENFYVKNGYTLQASLKDFYAQGDPKQIYSKIL